MDSLHEWNIPVPWGKLALLRWGSPEGQPVLLVHGRQDSSSVFKPLLKLMPETNNYVALDMPGNGLSDAFPCAPDDRINNLPQHYAVVAVTPPVPSHSLFELSKNRLCHRSQKLDGGGGPKLTRLHFLAAMAMAVDHLGWDKFIFMGHSMGCEQGLFYNAVHPGRITKMVLLDAGPALMRIQVDNPADYQRSFYDSYYENYHKESFERKSYTKHAAVAAVKRFRGLDDPQCKALLERNFHPLQERVPGGEPKPTEARNPIEALNPTQAPNPTEALEPSETPWPTEARNLKETRKPTKPRNLTKARKPIEALSRTSTWIPTQARHLNGMRNPTEARNLIKARMNRARNLTEARNMIDPRTTNTIRNPGDAWKMRSARNSPKARNVPKLRSAPKAWTSAKPHNPTEARTHTEALDPTKSDDPIEMSTQSDSFCVMDSDGEQNANGLQTPALEQLLFNLNLKREEDPVGHLSWDNRLKNLAPTYYGNDYYFELFKMIPPTIMVAASEGAKKIPLSSNWRKQAESLLQKMVDDLPNFHLVEVTGGHDVHFTHPERVAPHIKEYMDTLSCKL